MNAEQGKKKLDKKLAESPSLYIFGNRNVIIACRLRLHMHSRTRCNFAAHHGPGTRLKLPPFSSSETRFWQVEAGMGGCLRGESKK